MQSMLTKLIIVLIALVGWVVYSRMDQIKDFLGMVQESVPQVVEQTLEPDKPTPATTTVYKWQDASGEWHITSTPPDKATAIETKTYAHDVNVVPAVKPGVQEAPSLFSRSTESRNPSPSSDPLKALASEEGRNLSNLKRGLKQLQDMNREEDIDSTLKRAQ